MHGERPPVDHRGRLKRDRREPTSQSLGIHMGFEDRDPEFGAEWEGYIVARGSPSRAVPGTGIVVERASPTGGIAESGRVGGRRQGTHAGRFGGCTYRADRKTVGEEDRWFTTGKEEEREEYRPVFSVGL